MKSPQTQILQFHRGFDKETIYILQCLEGVFSAYTHFTQTELTYILEKYILFNKGIVCYGFDHSNPSHNRAIIDVLGLFEDLSDNMGDKLRRLAFRYAMQGNIDKFILVVYLFTLLAITPTINLCIAKWDYDTQENSFTIPVCYEKELL